MLLPQYLLPDHRVMQIVPHPEWRSSVAFGIDPNWLPGVERLDTAIRALVKHTYDAECTSHEVARHISWR